MARRPGDSFPETSDAVRGGRVRPPTADERFDPPTVLQPNAVLALNDRVPITDPTERRVADLIDGFRPVARIRQKSELSVAAVRQALASLRSRGALSLVGLVEQVEADALPAVAEPREPGPADGTVPRSDSRFIPPHVLKEIEGMVAEVAREKQATAEPEHPFVDEDSGALIVSFDDDRTTETKLPDADDPS